MPKCCKNPESDFQVKDGTTSHLRPKILFIGPYPPPYAGPETAMKLLLESDLREEFAISFLKTNVRKSNDQKGRFDLVIVLAFFSFIARLLCKLLEKNRPRAVYYFVTATRLGWIGRDIWCIVISRLFRCKVLIHFRAGHFGHSIRSLSSIEKKLIRYACSLVSLCLVQAQALKSQLNGFIEPSKIAILHNAIDIREYENQDLDDYDENIVLFMGHLSFAKGYCDILKLIPRIVKRYPNIRFYFAGTKIKKETNVFYNQITGEPLKFEDPDDCYDKYIAQRYEKNYRYCGIIYGQEKLNLIKRCNLLLLPSYSEGLSQSVLEAMCMGKPVICTPVGALKEVVKDGINGFHVTPGNISEMGHSLFKILDNKDLRDKIAKTNYIYTRKSFSTESVSRTLAQYFYQVISE